MRGIYIIKNEVNNKVYIGKSEDLYKRIMRHVNSLSKGNNGNKHLQAAFNKYGGGAFDISLLQILDEDDDINEREKYWINYFNATDTRFGYNKTKGGDGGNSYVECMTEEEKREHFQKLSDIHKKENNPIYGKHCYTDGKKLRYFSDEEAKEYLVNGWYKGIPESIRENEKQGNSGKLNGFYGKKHTDETKKKLSEERKGDKNWNYGHIIYHKGNQQKYILPSEIEEYETNGWIKGMSEEIKEKISQSNKGTKRNVSNGMTKIYLYNGIKFYGWRKLREFLIKNGYPKISETAIVKLSKGKSVRGYDDLINKITVI